MNVNPVYATAYSTSSTSGSSGSSTSSQNAAVAAASSTLNPNDFITLLAAQLKSQDPFNPIDPTTFVNQLVQFNTLEQVIAIQQDVAPKATTATGTGTGTGSSTGATVPTISQ